MSSRILVVEDESLVRHLIVEVLTEAGFQVDEASAADEAVKLIDADGYKLLVTDIHMHGRPAGIELAEHARQAEPGLPILFVTARPDVLERLSQWPTKPVFLAKPFSITGLIAAVRSLAA